MVRQVHANRKNVDLHKPASLLVWTSRNPAEPLKPNLADRALRKDLMKRTGWGHNRLKLLDSWGSYEESLGSWSRSPYGKMSTL
jgi:hypothetical protein